MKTMFLLTRFFTVLVIILLLIPLFILWVFLFNQTRTLRVGKREILRTLIMLLYQEEIILSIIMCINL